MESSQLLIQAIKCGVFFGELNVPENENHEDFKQAYILAKRQDFAHIFASVYGERFNGDIKNQLFKDKMSAVFRREKLDAEEERISCILRENSIDHMPLKGAVIKRLYPEAWMRTSSDIDILVVESQIDKAVELLKSFGYSYQGKSLHDHQFFSENGVHIELHYTLSANDTRAQAVLDRVWEDSKSECHKHEMSAEFLIFHTVVHGLYHFIDGGCGIKPFVDFCVLKSKLKYDEAKLLNLVKESGILKFYESFSRLAEVWFGEKEHDGITSAMERYILDGGVYGSKENFGKAKAHRKGGRFRYFMSRVFKPKKELMLQYPKLEKRPILLPFYQVRRWFNLFNKDKRQDIKTEAAGSMDNKSINKMFEELGL